MILTVRDVSFSYGGGIPVLDGVSFTAPEGSFISVLGPNGAGKSTLFRCILGNLTGYTGEILLDGVSIRGYSPREMARHIAYIPQTHRPAFGYSVADTVLMGTTRQLPAFGQPGPKQQEVARKAMELVGIGHLAQRDFARLSGGEQQLTLIARAIAQQADILVMDEPTSALDYGNQLRILQQVRELAQQGYTVLLSTHNPQHALQFSHRVLALYRGKILADGQTDSALTEALVERLYGVRAAFADTAAGRVLVPLREDRYER